MDKRNFLAKFVWLALAVAIQSSRAERVTVAYEAEASTVSGTPFGMTVPLLTVVQGYFTYETNTPDLSPSDVMRGNFLMLGTWDFRAEFLGKTVRGSGTANASTNLFGAPTLRFNDGVNHRDAGVMSIDGVYDATIGLGFSISGQAKDLPTDQLPLRFTFNPPPGGASHTFSLKDQSGTMLLQFRSFYQVALGIQSVRRIGDNVEITWSSAQGKPYALAFSTNLQHWTIIRSDLVGLPVTTTVVDPLALRFPGNVPSNGFYRILDRPPP